MSDRGDGAGPRTWMAIGHLDHLDQDFVDDVIATFAKPVRDALSKEGGAADEGMMDRLLRVAEGRAREGEHLRVPGHEHVTAYAGGDSPRGLAELELPELYLRETAARVGVKDHDLAAVGTVGWDPLALWIALVLESRRPRSAMPDAFRDAMFRAPEVDVATVGEPSMRGEAASLYVSFVARVASGLVSYADETWDARRHASLDDAFSEDLLALDGHTSGRRKRKEPAPPWYASLLGVCDDAVSWAGREFSDPDPFVDATWANPEFLACVGARQVHRMWPTVSEADGLRWIVEGGNLDVPDLSVEAGDDGSIVIRTLPSYVPSEKDKYCAEIWREVLAHRKSRGPHGIMAKMDYKDVRGRWPEEAKSTASAMTYLAYLFCELVIHDIRHWYPDESPAAREKKTISYESSVSRAVYRPKPHEGWEGCLECCLMISLRRRLIRNGKGKDESVSFEEHASDWKAVTDYLNNRMRSTRTYLERERKKGKVLSFGVLHINGAAWPDFREVETMDPRDGVNRFVEPWSTDFTELG